MKVLMINSVCGIRSTGRICTDLATALEEQGHEVKIAYGRETVPEQFQKYAVRIGSDLNVKLHGIKARLFDASGFGSKKATKKFIEWVKEWNPDVIHLHNIHGYYINIEILFNYLKTCDKKIIWTLHDCWVFTGHSAYCDAIQCEKWKTGCDHCPQKSEYPKSFTDYSKRNWKNKKSLFSDIPNMQIITPSKWLAGLLNESFLFEYPVTVIHNGIDTSQFYPLENDFRKVYGLDGKRILLGVASTWNDMKGYSDFIKLSEMLDDTYKIVLVGVSKEQKESLPNKMIGIERTNSLKELAMIYSASDLFVNLTYCDNYPTVNLEAIACGKYVVSYETGGSPESIGANGCTVDRGKLKEIVSSIENYFIHPCEVEDYEDFIKRSDKAVALRNYLEMYNSQKIRGVIP
ncbi:MAG: glycosyltransferase [Clostridiales bacterium]|nr:glycosyltransferase [Clostridiales bacterium]